MKDHFFGLHPTDKFLCCLSLKGGNRVLVILTAIWCAACLGDSISDVCKSSFWSAGFSNIFWGLFTVIVYIAWLMICFAGFRGVFRDDVRGSHIYYVWSYIFFWVRSVGTLILIGYAIFGSDIRPHNYFVDLLGDYLVPVILLALVGIFIEGYLVYMIFSYYHDLKEEREPLTQKIGV
mmetsp:Transcript_41272/g.47562  ORF Transcript_41272/g.47562 Transcript_41272/m.47562 type:complete len:178 (+) Transcript_41272:54-587(+)